MIRSPSRNALLIDAVDPTAYGRAYGFERAMDNAGAVLGPIFALGLVVLIGIRQAIFVSVIPGLLAAFAIVYANATPPAFLVIDGNHIVRAVENWRERGTSWRWDAAQIPSCCGASLLPS